MKKKMIEINSLIQQNRFYQGTNLDRLAVLQYKAEDLVL